MWKDSLIDDGFDDFVDDHDGCGVYAVDEKGGKRLNMNAEEQRECR